MEITVGAKLKVSNPTNDMIKWCRSNLIIDNTDYFKKERMGKWTGNMPRNIFLFETVGTDLYLPFGCLRTLWSQYGKTCPSGLITVRVLVYTHIKKRRHRRYFGLRMALL